MGFGPSPVSPAELAALVGSRLCHDLVSPLGAIGNGLELLQMVAEPSPELALIGEAVTAAQARVRLFRLAFGAASLDQLVRPADLVEALSALTGNRRISLRSALPQPLTRPLARRLTLAALCAETALARGGEVVVDSASVTALAPRLRIEPALWDSLAEGHPPEGLTPSTVHFALLAALGPVQIDTIEGALVIRL